MMHISFGWTAPAIEAQQKTCTRRHWKDSHARKFRQGDWVIACDKALFRGGKEIKVIKLTADPAREPISTMPDSDYEAEGFAYLAEHPELIPASMPYDVSFMGFRFWRNSGAVLWTVRFEYLNVSVEVAKDMDRLKKPKRPSPAYR